MKHILVVSIGTPTGAAIAEELSAVFQGWAQVKYCLCHQFRDEVPGQDVVLFSSKYCQALCRDEPPPPAALPAQRVINYRNLQEVIELEAGSRVLLVNDDKDTTAEAIDQLMEIGLTDLCYIPCFPGSPSHPEITTAITPGERACIPEHVTRIIDIGVRTLDIRTIYDLAHLLEAEHLLNQSLVARYLSQIVTVSKSLSHSRRQAERTERLLSGIFDHVDSGIAYVGPDLKLVRTNPLFESILGQDQNHLLGRRLEDLFGPKFRCPEEGSFVVPIRARTVLLRIKALEDSERAHSFLVTADYTDTIHKLNRRIRQDSAPAQRRRLYTFSDYLTWDQNCRNMLALAEKFTRTGGAVLIQGESGTGKEILAQSIHSGSARRRAPFIPVNITSLTSTLAESELFGYEDASFTGAKKGGRAGIFELADCGTVFIDEIGDASLELQAKLLRALEQRSIRRVGGAEEIPIRASVIAATNRDLSAMLRDGNFRKDLFFRLNMFPLATIPLRKRPGDILSLLEHFLTQTLAPELVQTLLGPEIRSFFLRYHWPGNVRELMNAAEYIKLTHEGRPLTPQDLPAYMLAPGDSQDRVFLAQTEYQLLSAVEANRGIGRNRLHALLAQEGVDLGVGKIRALLKSLEERGLVCQESSGCTITEQGRTALR